MEDNSDWHTVHGRNVHRRLNTDQPGRHVTDSVTYQSFQNSFTFETSHYYNQQNRTEIRSHHERFPEGCYNDCFSFRN